MRNSRLVLSWGLTAVVLAAAAAGVGAKEVGDQSLEVSANLTPAKASTKGHPRPVHFDVRIDYNSLNKNGQIKETTETVTLILPPGLKLHTERAPTCKLSDMNRLDSTGQPSGAAACPPGSQVGTGAATADARPDVENPVSADLKLFNGLHDVNDNGTPRNPPTPSIIAYAAANVGAVSIQAFDIVLGNRLQLDYARPASGERQLYHIQKLHLFFPKRGAKTSFVTAPGKCGRARKWHFAARVDNYDGPSVTAADTVRCRRP